MDTMLLGIVGGIVLVAGAAWPDRPGIKPVTSIKDWLFAVGGLLMLVYSSFNYLAGGSIFFIFLQAVVNLSSIFMMFDVDDRIDEPIIAVATVSLIVTSFILFPGFGTIPFVLGLGGIALGYCSTGGTVRREAALFVGSALIALFSYLDSSWVFFWLNVFFAFFSLVQILSLRKRRA